MKKNFKFSMIAAIMLAVVFLQGCQKEDELDSQLKFASLSKGGISANEKPRTFYGPTQPLGNGVMRAWVTENRDGSPLSIGVNLSVKALEGLPDIPSEFVLSLPNQAEGGFYTQLGIDWNPNGHEPEGTYSVPHFDFHFYTIPEADRLAIGPLAPPNMDIAPAAKYVPPFYIQTPGVVPAMGAHWVDVLSPEFHGSPFTKTFIWGSYHGEFIFWEPMVTLAHLLSKPEDLVSLRLPEAYQRDGWYPTKYKVSYSDTPGEYSIALVDLVYHDGE